MAPLRVAYYDGAWFVNPGLHYVASRVINTHKVIQWAQKSLGANQIVALYSPFGGLRANKATIWFAKKNHSSSKAKKS